MTSPNLGRLERVDIRSVWTTEDRDFTPWLAQEHNMKLLGEAVGLELELEAEEKSVGPFRADILCKNTADSSWVLIENQLERTDHTHLGQLMTYAAGLQTVTIIWVAARFTEEHRAALDWLNEITNERFQFFGLEVELWRIGDSIAAPKFNVISKPNEWSRSASQAARVIENEPASATQALQLEFWTGFNSYIGDHGIALNQRTPGPRFWHDFPVGRQHFGLSAYCAVRDGWIGVTLRCTGRSAKAHFGLLLAEKEQIEMEMGNALQWDELPNNVESQISIKNKTDPKEKANWPTQYKWLADQLVAFTQVFPPRLRALDATQYSPATEPLAVLPENRDANG